MTSQKVPHWRLDAPSGLSLAAARKRGGNAMATPTAGAPLQRILRPEAVSRWRGTTVAYYTPQIIELTLRNALMGDLTSQWELFDLMEDTWPRLAKNLAEVKRAVKSMQWTVEPWAEDDAPATPEAEERAKLISHCLWRMSPDVAADERNFPGLIEDVLDAWGKGISVSEIIWEQRMTRAHGDIFAIKGTQWVHPQHYALGSDGRLGLKLQQSDFLGNTTIAPIEVEEFPPYKFVLAVSKARSNQLAASALLRPLAWWWGAVNFAADWMLNYAQMFGVPVRWANYASGTSDAMITKIGEALSDMGSAGWAAFPEGTTLELHDGKSHAGDSPQEGILDRADNACDLLVLGQTLTSDAADRGTQALGTVHERIRGDVLTSAAEWVATTLTEQLLPAILDLNYGDHEDCPELRAEPFRSEDHRGNAERDEILLRAGMALPKKWLYERHEVPLPQGDEEVVGGEVRGLEKPASAPQNGVPPQVTDPETGGDGSGDAAAARSNGSACHCKPVLEASSPVVSGMDPVDAIALRKAEVLATAYRGHLAPLRQVILQAKSPQEALNAAVNLYADWPVSRVSKIVREALELCAVAGASKEMGDGE